MHELRGEGGPLRAQSPLRGFFALAQSPCRGFLALAQSPTDSIAWRIFSSARVGRVVGQPVRSRPG